MIAKKKESRKQWDPVETNKSEKPMRREYKILLETII
jgi:hypothetical protein